MQDVRGPVPNPPPPTAPDPVATPVSGPGATPVSGPGATAGSPVALQGPPGLGHTWIEDLVALLTGTFVASFGLFLLSTGGAVTGGTAGLALLVAYAVGAPFGVVFVLINVPFFALAAWKKGWRFTARTVVCVLVVSGFSFLHPLAVPDLVVAPAYAVVCGNLLVGIGLLVLFRHGASLGGFNILALVLQERVGWRAGYVQMVLDVLVIAAALAVVAPPLVLLSVVGAVVLNAVLALNHRPGRYLGA